MPKSTSSIIKLLIAVLLMLCLFKMPYGFYNLVRFCAMFGFTILAFNAYQSKQTPWVIVYVALAILFQPFAKIVLGREIWTVVDVLCAISLIITIFVPKKS